MSAPVSVIIDRKGADCETIGPDASLAEVTRRLTERGIGALVVSADGVTVDGIISERDVVRTMAHTGAEALTRTVAEVMSAPVTTCTLSTSTDEVMAIMTDRRIRHLPVVEDGCLAGIVSIGDVVKWRIDELQQDAERLQEYVQGRY